MAVLPRLSAGAAGRATRLAASLCLLASPAAAQPGYAFLGDLDGFEAGEGGGSARCGGDTALRIQFIDSAAVRITLDRPDHPERLLEHAFAAPPVPLAAGVRVAEAPDSVLLATARLSVTVGRDGCRLSFRDADGRLLARGDSAMGIGWAGDEVRAWLEIADGDRFFGLGEKTGDVDRRGREWVMWNSDTPAYGNDTDPIYQSIPFLIGVRAGRAYGVFLNNSHRTRFNLGAGNHRYWSIAAEGGALDWVFFAGPGVPDVVRRYTALTGRQAMPPLWALGFQQSRWSYYPDDEVLRIARTFREKRIPADVIYLDIHYMDGYRVFTWDGERFPDPTATLATLDSLGFKPIVIVDPGVKEDSAYAIAREGLAGDHFVTWPDGTVYVGSVWPGRSFFPDFARAETRTWWGGHLAVLRALGVRGIWNDMNEPAVWGRAFPDEALMQDSAGPASFKRMHNLYAHLMARATYEELRRRVPDERPFVLTRAGFAGGQRWSAVWTGDNVASFDHLELGIRMMLGLGLSGVAFNGTDVGGFEGAPSAELFARWMQVGAFSPFFRAHTANGTPAQEPWSFGERVEEIARTAVVRRYRMLPYLYTLMHDANTTGAPVLRPLFWHHPDDAQAWDRTWQHQFLVGEKLLVAPVTRSGVTLQRVYLPAGRWLELDTHAVHDGGRTVVVDAPLERIPTFLAEGGILPLGVHLQHVGERTRDTLTLEIFAGDAAAAIDLYEDDGISNAWEDGAYRTTRYTARRADGRLTLRSEVVHDGYAPPTRVVVARFHDVATAPRTVDLDGTALPRAAGWTHDASTRTLIVRYDETAGHVLTVR